MGAYNPVMIHTLRALLAPALMERLVLVINHVMQAEPAAMARMAPHARRVLWLELANWPKLLPELPPLALRVTPAGLVEWCADPHSGEADLHARIDAANPAALGLKALGGEPPELEIRGNVQLAADIDWLLKNVRWDVAGDLERLFGPLLANELHRLGSALGKGLRQARDSAGSLRRMVRKNKPAR